MWWRTHYSRPTIINMAAERPIHRLRCAQDLILGCKSFALFLWKLDLLLHHWHGGPFCVNPSLLKLYMHILFDEYTARRNKKNLSFSLSLSLRWNSSRRVWILNTFLSMTVKMEMKKPKAAKQNNHARTHYQLWLWAYTSLNERYTWGGNQ